MNPRPPLRVDSALPLPPRAYPALIAAITGLALILGSWIGVSGEPAFEEHVSALNVAVGGLVVVAGGSAAYLVEFRRAVRRRVQLTTGTETP